ncbi:helix-turn-helix domain-containing protein [Bordetella genomosp. 1]|uniref:helix-turn-helix domain-containing protein n=1 Tax=Bordetella genomosp. 1 TaxID=1395607 RepID=UPI001594F782|nr:helix-turn-helix transcriptional regulator [Bordetella genomosp. 1]
MSTFSDRLRDARAHRGWTQKELAEISGLTPSAIGNYESGQRIHPSGTALLKLAQVLNVSPVWLGEGDASAVHPTPTPRYPQSSSTDSRWPFRNIDFARYSQLKPQQKRQLEILVAAYIESCGA